jgi:hypothetical protein
MALMNLRRSTALFWSVLAASALGMAAPQIVSTMTHADVAEAIQAGERGKVPSGEIRAAGPGWALGDTIAHFSTPFLRVAFAARQARVEFRRFATEDVAPDLVGPELHIYASPYTLGARVADVTAVVITPRRGSKQERFERAIHPASLEPVPVEYRNLFGAVLAGEGKLAIFPLSALSEDNELQVAYENGLSYRGRFNLKGVR